MTESQIINALLGALAALVSAVLVLWRLREAYFIERIRALESRVGVLEMELDRWRNRWARQVKGLPDSLESPRP